MPGSRRKIALFANGWNNEYLRMTMSGIRKCADEENIDLFMFINYAAYNELPEKNAGEFNIFNLPVPGDFDGIILFSNSLNSEEILSSLSRKIIASDIPSISFERKIENMDYIGTDNYSGMFELVTHLIQDHGIRHVIFYGGPEENLESRERLRAVRDAMSANGREFTDDNIFYGTWAFTEAVDFTRKFIESECDLPDAFICANDYMAMGVITELNRHGISVPRDTVVTGYDYIDESKICYPAVTSVERGWDVLGYRGCRHLLSIMSGKKPEHDEILPTHLVSGESCGCRTNGNILRNARLLCSNTFEKSMNDVVLEHSITDLENAISSRKVSEDIYSTLRNYYSEHLFLGRDFYALADSAFTDSIVSGKDLLAENGYSDSMKILLAVRDGEFLPCKETDTRSLVPGYDGSYPGDNHLYIFLPMHYMKESFGYLVFCDSMDMINDRSMYSWMSRLNQNIEKFRQSKRLELLNSKLNELYTKDSLTDLFNRFGIDMNAIPLYKELCAREERCIVLFADINRMKQINDRYGHLQGDLAIHAVANAIKNSVPGEWITIRYGGDEFLAIGKCNDTASADTVKQKIESSLEEMAVHMSLPYPLTVSIGYQLTEPDSGRELIDYINTADEEMYLCKQEMHRLEDKC